MFEKEAEEYARQNNPAEYGVKATHFTVLNSFKDGAEFGYKKANEWHYVKDELPPSDKDKYYFVVDKLNEPMIARFYEGKWSNYSVIEDAIAWKEIVLPKESE